MAEIDTGELERLGSALRLAQSALEEALEAAENLGSFDRRFDCAATVPVHTVRDGGRGAAICAAAATGYGSSRADGPLYDSGNIGAPFR